MSKLILAIILGLTSLANADILLRTSGHCSTEGKSCYDLGVMTFNIYRESRIKEIREKTENTKINRIFSAPFSLLHPERTKYSALLIHGLNDSPYYLKDIAKILHDQGMNVITILLPGHGLTLEDMAEIKYQQWIRELRWGLKIAGMLGENVLVGGFSTGGVLATTAILETNLIRGLLLFAPALQVLGPMNIGNRTSFLTCLKGLNQISYESELEENPVKYGTRSLNSICQLAKLISNLYYKVGESLFFSKTQSVIEKLAEKVTVPVFTALTTEDHRVPYEAIIDFAKAVKGRQKTLVYTPDVKKIKSFPGVEFVVGEAIQHSFLVLKENEFNPQKNPSFGPLERSLNEFLSENFQ